jgi:nitroreductase
MDTITAIHERRAVKHYDPAFKMPAEDEAKLLKAFRQSPTSFNIQNWRVVNVKDPSIRLQIQEAAWGQEQVTKASLLLVLCADIKAWEKNPARYWENAPEEVKNYLVPMIKPFYENQDQKQRDEAMRSVGIGAQTLMLAAKAMGYDSCPMIGFDPDAVAKIINLPDDHAIGMLLTIGKATKPAFSKPGHINDNEVFLTDKFAG